MPLTLILSLRTLCAMIWEFSGFCSIFAWEFIGIAMDFVESNVWVSKGISFSVDVFLVLKTHRIFFRNFPKLK